MAYSDISLLGATYPTVPSVLLPKSGGGNVQFYDVSQETTAVEADVVAGKKIFKADGSVGTGSLAIQHYYTGSSAPSSSLGVNGDIYLQTS